MNTSIIASMGLYTLCVLTVQQKAAVARETLDNNQQKTMVPSSSTALEGVGTTCVVQDPDGPQHLLQWHVDNWGTVIKGSRSTSRSWLVLYL